MGVLKYNVRYRGVSLSLSLRKIRTIPHFIIIIFGSILLSYFIPSRIPWPISCFIPYCFQGWIFSQIFCSTTQKLYWADLSQGVSFSQYIRELARKGWIVKYREREVPVGWYRTGKSERPPPTDPLPGVDWSLTCAGVVAAHRWAVWRTPSGTPVDRTFFQYSPCIFCRKRSHTFGIK